METSVHLQLTCLASDVVLQMISDWVMDDREDTSVRARLLYKHAAQLLQAKEDQLRLRARGKGDDVDAGHIYLKKKGTGERFYGNDAQLQVKLQEVTGSSPASPQLKRMPKFKEYDPSNLHAKLPDESSSLGNQENHTARGTSSHESVESPPKQPHHIFGNHGGGLTAKLKAAVKKKVSKGKGADHVEENLANSPPLSHAMLRRSAGFYSTAQINSDMAEEDGEETELDGSSSAIVWQELNDGKEDKAMILNDLGRPFAAGDELEDRTQREAQESYAAAAGLFGFEDSPVLDRLHHVHKPKPKALGTLNARPRSPQAIRFHHHTGKKTEEERPTSTSTKHKYFSDH